MKRIRFAALELEAIEQALSLWEATADTEEDGDVSAEDARRLRDANGSAHAKIAVLRGRLAEEG